MSLEQIGKRAGRMLADKMREYINENKSPVQPPKQSFPSQSAGHQAMVAAQYPGNQQSHITGHFQSQQPFAAPLPTDQQIEPMDVGDLNALKLPDPCNNVIPDFSRVGYREGHVRIPMVPVRMVVEPSLDPYADDTARIQSAIDAVGSLPLECVGNDGARIRGAVLLKAGTYRVAGALIINASGVVLRGEGQDEHGTIVVATGNIQRDFILVNGMLTSDMGSVDMQRTKARTREMMPTNGYRGSRKPDTYTRSNVIIPVGSTHIPVLDTKGYNIGDRIVIERPGCDEWIRDIGMENLPPRPDNCKPSTPWTAKSFTFRFERKIVGINQATQTFIIDIPTVMTLDPKYPPARIYDLIHKFPMISDVGVENMRLVSETDPNNPEDENHGWYAVVVDNTINGWVADVTTMHFVSGIFASTWSRFITIQDCSVLYPISKPREGGRRYQFNLSGQMGLVKRCFTNQARHDFITLGRVCGPNVFVDSTGADGNNDTGPHERWAMGILYDNITCNTINVRQRGWMGSGQGWAGVFHVVYNCTANVNNNCFQDAPGTTNWIIGFRGGLTNKVMFEGPCTRPILHNRPCQPRSLYWAQLVTRMGGDIQYVKSNVGAEARMKYPPQIEEILVEIVSHLDRPSLLSCVSVSKIFYRASIRILWSKVQWKNQYGSNSFLPEFNRYGRYAVELQDNFNVDLDRVAHVCTKLRELRLIWTTATDEKLANIFRSSPRISVLYLYSCKFLSSRALNNIGSLHELKRLELKNMIQIDESSLVLLLRSCPLLEHLALEDVRLGEVELSSIGSTPLNIKSLSLTRSSPMGTLVVNLLRNAPQIQELSLARNIRMVLTREELLPFRDMYQHISVLNVESCKSIESEALLVLVHTCPNLKRVNMGGTMIDDRALDALNANCPNLRSLNLSCCVRISDEGLLRFLESCSGLTFLDISTNGTISAAIFQQETRPWRLTRIETLTMTGINMLMPLGSERRNHAMMFNQLSCLESLQDLAIGSMSMVMELSDGLSKLGDLVNLETFRIQQLQNILGDDEIRWFVEAWPKLKRIKFETGSLPEPWRRYFLRWRPQVILG
ncbi:hypothetical protein BGZ51_003973 [Haplosporangium sp. Z 767]|nr:hypothetical protein BGZ51_003973 [Haplosporangium sp. Z 767]KAF9195054.1 hypothetical protein BGZ50_005275 [Haplosporangium sp. Z 11]